MMNVEEADDTKTSKDQLNDLVVLSDVELDIDVLAQGSYGTVYKAKHSGIPCAAKRADMNVELPHLVKRKKRNFILECLQHSKLRHPNIVKMLGVFYLKEELPFLVMELIERNLTQLLKNHQNIFMYVKLSILQDVSKGLCYLHAQSPPIVHQALYSDNILVTETLIAKIGDFKTGARTVSDQALFSVRHNTDCNDFLPDLPDPKYELPLNVFSFGCMVCHVITQRWPSVQYEPLVKPKIKVRKSNNYYGGKRQRSLTSAYAKFSPAIKRRQSYTLDDWLIKKHKNYIDLISDDSLKQLVEACLQHESKNRPQMSLIDKRITSIMKGEFTIYVQVCMYIHGIDHCNDDNMKTIYSLVMKQGLDQSTNFQLLLIGAENTGKTSLISSFLGEEFLEKQLATEGVNVEVCRVCYKDWTRITHSDKSNILYGQFTHRCRENVLKTMVDSYTLSSPKHSSCKPLCRTSSITYSDVLSTNAPLTKSMIAPSTGAGSISKIPFQSCPDETPQEASLYNSDSLIASLWDFAGQVIFHNSHSVFISDAGVSVITFNASMKLTDNVIPREGTPQPRECHTIISSIHYWLQVVNSVCSVKENVLLVGTHIDKLHNDVKEAREVASNKILPELEKELCGKPYAQHIAGISKGLKVALKQSCFFVSNKCRDKKEIENLKATAVEVAISLREEKLIFFLKIEQALLQLNAQVISVSKMLDLVTENGFPLDIKSPEFKGILKYFHSNRIILHFSQIESLKDLVILSPNWLAKLFSYVIAAHSYNKGNEFDWAWKRLTNYGILHECLIQHMLDKFHLDYPVLSSIQVTKQQAVDLLLCFQFLARITSKAWFTEEGFPQLPGSGDTFIVPSLVYSDDGKNPPQTEKERTIYFMFNNGFVPMSLLNQLIAKCICRSVSRNDQLLW